jgi:methyl-accepting chemotaxis protein
MRINQDNDSSALDGREAADSHWNDYRAVTDYFKRASGDRADLAAAPAGSGELAGLVAAFLGSLESKVTGLLDDTLRLSRTAAALDADVAELDGALRGQRERIAEIDAFIDGHRRGLAGLAAATETVAAAAAATVAATAEGEEAVRTTERSVAAIDDRIARTGAFIAKLDDEFGAIKGSMATVQDIAGQLGVIAINTAIEAARAGDKGRGFAVIAKEVQGLAKRSAASAEEVDGRLDKIDAEFAEVGRALADSREAAAASRRNAATAVARFAAIGETYRSLERGFAVHAKDIAGHAAATERLAVSAGSLAAGTGRIAELSAGAKRAADDLERVVEANLGGLGTFRIGAHARALRVLAEVAAGLPERAALDRAAADLALAAVFRAHPYFELFYLMDSGGRQISSNVVHPRYRGVISDAGFGADRAGKEYFAAVRRTGGPYVSDFYVSTASGNLCLTVSAPLPAAGGSPAVLAGDINMDDLAALEAEGA